MKYKKTTFTAKLVRWTFPNICQYELPKSFCKYYRLAFFSWLFIPFTGLYYIAESIFFTKKYEDIIPYHHTQFITKVWRSIYVPFFSFLLLWAFTLLGNEYGIDNSILAFLGGIISVAGVIVLLVLLTAGWDYSVESIKDYRRSKRHKNDLKRRNEVEVEKKPNLFIEYLKAKKEKICPIIEWED
jgi:hypothetical protein